MEQWSYIIKQVIIMVLTKLFRHTQTSTPDLSIEVMDDVAWCSHLIQL